MKRIFIILALTVATTSPTLSQLLPKSEGRLSASFEALKTTHAEADCMELHAQIDSTLYKALQDPASFDYPFESLTFLGKIYSDDQLIRIYTWNIPLEDGAFTYGCIIQQKKNNKLTKFNIKESAYKPATDKIVNPVTNWYGALYYQAVPIANKKTTNYVLLGWAGNDDLTTLKMIDVLTLSANGKAQLGAPVFNYKNKMLSRFVFEYSDQYNMTLDYNKKNKQIIFDRLQPSAPKYEGIYTNYGPSFIYDAFLLKKREWIFRDDIDARNDF